METAKEHIMNVYICFIYYTKYIECVDHERLWVISKEMGVPVHLIVLLQKLYTKQEATIRTEFGETYTINIRKGVRQGYFLSPLLFNIYAENIMREVLEDWDGGIRIKGRRITNLRYADDTTLVAETKSDLIAIMERVKLANEKAGIFFNVGKTEVMMTEDQ